MTVNPRRICPQCQQMRTFRRAKQKTCSRPCSTAALRAAGHYARAGRNGQHSQRQIGARFSDALRQLGASDAVVALAQKGRIGAYSAGHMRGKDYGYRKGWADALGERDDRKGQAA